MNLHEVFIHIHQGCFAGTGAIVRLPQCLWSEPDGYGKISQCITTTKHSKAKTVYIFLGIYCMLVITHLRKGNIVCFQFWLCAYKAAASPWVASCYSDAVIEETKYVMKLVSICTITSVEFVGLCVYFARFQRDQKIWCFEYELRIHIHLIISCNRTFVKYNLRTPRIVFNTIHFF